MAGRHVISRIEGINKERLETETCTITIIRQRGRSDLLTVTMAKGGVAE